jgi:hypothetical protein
MATKLDKDVIRESSVIANDRNIMITLSSEQKIKMKLKGMKSGEVEITLEELYNLLTKKPEINTGKIEKTSMLPEKNEEKNVKGMISLSDFRSQYIITSDFDLNTKVKLETITTKLLNK